jgi:hypothetical protein
MQFRGGAPSSTNAVPDESHFYVVGQADVRKMTLFKINSLDLSRQLFIGQENTDEYLSLVAVLPRIGSLNSETAVTCVR